MDLAASELWKLFQGCSGILVRGGAGGQCDEDLIGVDTNIFKKLGIELTCEPVQEDKK